MQDQNKTRQELIAELETLSQEISQLRAAEAEYEALRTALRESEENFRNIVESIPIGMHRYQLEPDGRLVFAGSNPAADKILGIDHHQFLGKTVEESFPALVGTELPERYRTAASAGVAWQTDEIFYQDDEIKGTYEVRAFQTSARSMVVAFTDITESKQAEEVLRAERDRAMALEQAADVVSSSLDLDQVLDRILEQITGVVPCDATNVMFVKDGQAHIVRWRGYQPFGVEEQLPSLVYQVSKTPTLKQMTETREPLAVPDTRTFPGWVQLSPTEWVSSYASAPIIVQDEVIGFLNVDSAISGFFTQAHAATLRAFADHAAVAIRNARLYEAEQERRHIAETLRQASTILNSTLELNEVLDLILEQLQQVIPYDSGSVQRLEDNHLVVVACRGFEEPAKVTGLYFPLDAKFPNHQVVTTKAPLIIEDISQQFPHFEQEADTYKSGHIRSWLGVPLVVKDQVIGMIALDRVKVHPYTAEEGQLAMAFANQAAIAIENAHLFEETERYRAFSEGIVQTVPGAILVTDAQGNLTFVNPAAVDLLGYTPQELLGQHWSMVFPTDQQPIVRAADERRTRGESDRYESELLRKDGNRVPVLISGSPRFDSSTGHFAGTLSVLTDITPRVRAERLLEALNQTAQAIAKALTPEEIFQAISEEFKKLGFSYVVFLTDESQSRLYPRYLNHPRRLIKAAEQLAGVRTEEHSIPVDGIDLYQEVIWERKTVFVDDVEDAIRQTLPSPAKRLTRRFMQMLKASKFIATPLMVEDRIIGVLTVQSDDVTEEDAPAITAFGHQVAAAWHKAQLYEQAQQEIAERMQAQEEIKRLKEFNEGIVQSMAEGIIVEDSQGRFTFVNPAGADLLGYTPQELVGQSWTALVPSDQEPVVRAAEKRRLRAEFDQYDLELMHKDGTRVPVLMSDSPRFVSGKLAGTLTVFTDITARVKAEREIHGRNRALTLLNQIIAASASDLEPEAILETACRELARTFEVPQVGAVLINEDKTEGTVVAETLGKGQTPAVGVTIPVKGNPSFQYLLGHKAPLIVKDAQTDPRLEPLHDLMQRRGTVSMLLLPLIIKGEVVGSLGLDALEPRQFSAEEVSLAWSAADQVAGALARARLNEQRQRLEAQYRQAQKMEAVGRLTAGIAHDFNNLLTAINGFAELTRLQLLPDDPLHEMVEKVLHSGRRAADLVRQLLAFSRKQIIEPQVLNLNTVVSEMDKMLRRVIGEDIELKTSLAPDLWPVRVDPAQIGQVIANLAVNARDAMPEGGELTVKTDNVVLDTERVAQDLELESGEYVILIVSDTGVGMSEEVKIHLFEPFFTTKEPGKGTGLGLATVYGVVKQSGGGVRVHSQPGEGTAFEIYLPRVEEAVQAPPRPRGMADLPLGEETVLLVEDDDSVRDLAWRVLQGQGYTVLQAGDGQQAIQVAANHTGAIHLLVTDLVMPGISGKTLADQLTPSHPDLKVLYISGYTDELIASHGIVEPGVTLLQKPFRPIHLAQKVRQVLDAPR